MLEPHQWNVVVVGSWNPAILTPFGMVKRVFGLQAGTPVQIEVPIDGVGSPRITHENTTATLAGTKLILEPNLPTYDGLKRAMEAASRTIEALPETPLSAAGFNIRFTMPELLTPLVQVVESRLDDVLSDAGFTISQRTLGRSLPWQAGRINLTINAPTDGPCVLQMNFDRRSAKADDLSQWLRTPIDEIRVSATQILGLLNVEEAVSNVGSQ